MSITITDYWMGRDTDFADELTPRVRANAGLTVERVNGLLEAYAEATGETGARKVNSGWRPLAINNRVRGAAGRSKHLTGEACDLDDFDGALDAWCTTGAGLAALEAHGLWLEHPDSTVGWCHVQTVPPGSGRRVFKP